MQHHTTTHVKISVLKALSFVDFLRGEKTFWAKWHTGMASLIFNEKVKSKLIFYKCIIRFLMETIYPEVQCLV